MRIKIQVTSLQEIKEAYNFLNYVNKHVGIHEGDILQLTGDYLSIKPGKPGGKSLEYYKNLGFEVTEEMAVLWSPFSE